MRVHAKAGTHVRANERKDEMKDMKTGGHEKKRRTEVCEGEKDEKGTKWRGRKPMTPNLIKEPRQALLNMYVLCVHLSSRQTPMSLNELGSL